MIQSEVSGVMFTMDPVKNNKSNIIVEAVWGLGEFIVQGTVNPDHYEIKNQEFRIISKEISSQNNQLIKVGNQNKKVSVGKAYRSVQKLHDRYIKSLAGLGKKIEDHYGFPQD